jgi:polyhydroxyalkanoate synthesis regulator phasin
MSQTDGLRRYFEAALALSQITRARAEEVVRDLIRTGELESNRAQDWVEDLVRSSRQQSEAFVGTVRSEVRRQLDDLGLKDVNDLARRVAEILDKAESAARRAAGGAGRRAGRPRTAGKRSGPAKKATAARKAAAKKTTAAKKATAKKATTARRTAAKKTAAAGRRRT